LATQEAQKTRNELFPNVPAESGPTPTRFGGTVISTNGPVFTEQVNSTTLITYTNGDHSVTPVYSFIYPQNQGSWGTLGSDGKYWIGCMSCHSSIGAFNYAAYNSQERWTGVVIGAVFTEFTLGAFGTFLNASKGGVTNTALTKYWPENGGALGMWESEFLMPGTQIDRFGSGFGKYFSPRDTPMTMRALPGDNTGAYNSFLVVKPFEVQSSTIAPAFGKMGLGKQYLAPVNMNTLLKRGIITPF
jgi:hypothetical protein